MCVVTQKLKGQGEHAMLVNKDVIAQRKGGPDGLWNDG